MFKKLVFVALVLSTVVTLGVFSSCKGCKKETPTTNIDTTTATAAPIDMITTPHGDTSLIPVFTQILDDAFAASAKKDYVALGKLMVYRGGADMQRFGNDVFNATDPYEKAIVKATADVFNKWNKGVQTKEYPRVFSMQQPDGRELQVLEVLFIEDVVKQPAVSIKSTKAEEVKSAKELLTPEKVKIEGAPANTQFNRKFFAFLLIGSEYKIVDVTSYLQ